MLKHHSSIKQAMAFNGPPPRLCARLRRIVFFLCLAAAPVFLSSLAVGQLPAVLTTQEALPGNVAGVARSKEPVSVGLPLADAQAISSISQLGLSGVAWRSGHRAIANG